MLRAERGQSEVVGFVLLLGLTVLVVSTTVALGSVALEDTQSTAQLQKAKAAMTQVDSKASLVAHGKSPSQQVQFEGHDTGALRVDEDAGWMRIEVEKETETIERNVTLGKVVYDQNGRTVAYQGGGVWRQTGTRSQMVSPPEFHYRAATLTLPVVLVRGTASAGGAPTAVIEQQRATVAKYPNASATYAGDPDRKYLNPAKNGSIHVTVTGEYYRGWADYFDQRTDGTVVSVSDTEQSVTAKLMTKGNQGKFDIPSDDGTDKVEVRGLQDGGLQELNFTLHPNADKFSSVDWSMYVEEGDHRLEIHLDGASNGKCGNTVDLTVYYTDDGGDTYHGWIAQDAYTITCKDYDGDGNDEARLEVSLTNSTIDAEYSSISGKLAQYNPGSGGGSLADSVTFDEFESDPETDNTYNKSEGDTESIDVVVNHYFSHFGPRFNLLAADGNNGNTVSESDSTGDSISYTGTDVITYLHVSENEVEVRFE